MNPLIKKEIRLLLPAWIAAMLLAIVPALIWRFFWVANRGPDAWESFNYLLSFDVPLMVAFGILCLGIASFGQEFSSNTFAVLLSQPAERRRLWTVKSNVLALASASVWLVAIILIAWQFDSLERERVVPRHFANPDSPMWEALAFLTISSLAVCSGGLWTTLLLRQIAGAFWVTIFAPVAIVFGFGTVLGFFPITDQVINVITSLLLLGYSIAGFYWARRLFFQAQDAQWTGGNVLFPWRRKSVEQTSSFIRLPRNRFVALVWKEIRLHEVNLFIAAVLLAVHVAALVLHPFVSNRNTKMVLELVWSLWLLMPLLIGSSAVAEERKLGVLESQLCLPASRRSQFWVKFFVGLTLSMILGALMPTIVERTHDFGTLWFPYWIFPAAAAIFFVSFYASTLSRSTLHAIGIAIVFPMIVWFGFMIFLGLTFLITSRYSNNDYHQYPENVFHVYLLMGICLLICPFVLVGLMFWNFKWLHQGWKVFRFNATTILMALALVFVLTNTVYYRPWELLAPTESPHGPARLSAETPAQLAFDSNPSRITALLPDGRLWQENIGCRWRDFSSREFVRWSPSLQTERFVNGSNWIGMALNDLYMLGIQRNGSLWCMPQIGSRVRMAQIGLDTNWLKIAANADGFLLLKKNGTLWLWGTNNVTGTHDWNAHLSQKIKLDLAMPPVCIDASTNWSNIVPINRVYALAQKEDGTFWKWQANGNDNFSLIQDTNLDNQASSYAVWWRFSVEIKTDGELWLLEQPQEMWEGYTGYSKKTKLDSEPGWKAASFTRDDALILLRRDGTLWKWNCVETKSFHPIQLGHYSDWVALSGDNWAGIALAEDGSLWSWNQDSDRFWWLATSRRPVYMGNVLEGSP